MTAASLGVYTVAGSQYSFGIEGEMTVSVSRNGTQPAWINLDEFSLRQAGQVTVLGYTMANSHVEPANFFRAAFRLRFSFRSFQLVTSHWVLPTLAALQGEVEFTPDSLFQTPRRGHTTLPLEPSHWIFHL